jgi:hypothetical protein
LNDIQNWCCAMKKHNGLYILSIVFFALFVASVIFYSYVISIEDNYLKLRETMIVKTSPTPKKTKPSDIFTISTVNIAFASMIILGVGTFSTLILTWGSYRKNAIETKLRIEKLELEIAELKLKKR